MSAERKGFSLDLSVNPLTVLAVLVGAVLAYYVWKLLGWGSNAVTGAAARVNAALDKTAEESGYLNSAGQTDPSVRYVSARIAYARSIGLEPGDANWLSPPGFPDRETWLAQNPVDAPSSWSLFWDNL